jgi:hypothetical protein
VATPSSAATMPQATLVRAACEDPLALWHLSPSTGIGKGSQFRYRNSLAPSILGI